MDYDLLVEEDFLGPKKSKDVPIGVAELMRTLKPKKKRPINKGKNK